ncbi:hypothetical protein ABW19_dt0204276 [Dactylella cylindrospora]|nr:hypothetical protein ABW19_dt0204276 [Dactylella cylindrospora]
MTLLKICPIQNPFEKDPTMKRFPKTLTRDSFPKFVDGDTRRLWDLFVPDPDEGAPAARPANPRPNRPQDQEQREREREREREQRVLEVLQDREASNRSLTPRGNAGGFIPPPVVEEEPKPEPLRPNRGGYESRPPPPIPNDNGIERQRSPYSRTTPVRKEDITGPDYDDDYDKINHAFYAVPTTETPISPRIQNGPAIPPKARPLSPPLSGGKDKRISDFDREEEDLYKVMAAKRAEIAAIEDRIKKQTIIGTPQIPAERSIPIEMASPQPSADLEGGYDSEEEAEIRRRAEEDWDREAREREKWVESRRRKLEMQSGGGMDDPATPVSHYSWRDSYSTPAAAAAAKRNTQQNYNTGRSRLSGGGEWEEFRIDEGPGNRRTSISHGHDRSYSGASSGWPRDPYSK